MQDEVIVGDKSAKYRYLWYQNKLRPLPTGLLSLVWSALMGFSHAGNPLMQGVIPGCLRDLQMSPGKKSDESIYHFFVRRFNPEVAMRLIDPMTLGIYAGDIRKLSIKSCFPKIYQWEQEYGSVIKGAIKNKNDSKDKFSTCSTSSQFIKEVQKSSLFSFKSGMGVLINRLAEKMADDIILSQEVVGFDFDDHLIKVKLGNNEIIEADQVYSTLSANVLSSLFLEHNQELSGLLSSIPSTSVAVVNVGYHKSVHNLKGFGYLVPSSELSEGAEILGVVFDSSVFPQQNLDEGQTRLTVMIGGAHMLDFDTFKASDFELMALRALDRHLGIKIRPDVISVKIARNAISQYTLGHAARVAHIESILKQNYPRFSIHGHSFHGVALNDCIANSKLLEEGASLYSA